MKYFRLLLSERNLYLFIWFLFLFLNLICRLIYKDFNWLLYVFFFMELVFLMKRYRNNWLSFITLLTAIYWGIFIIDPRGTSVDNIYAFKLNVVSLLALFITLYMPPNARGYLNFLNLMFFPFMFYGVVQEAVFMWLGRMQGLMAYMPWEVKFITDITTYGGISNLFQPGGLLRFFGTMNSFIEYQVASVCLLFLLWLNYPLLKRKKLFIVNSILLIAFQALAIERSPIMFLIIFLFVWKLPTLIHYALKNILVILLVVVFVVALLSFSVIDFTNPLIAGAIERLSAVATLDFQRDEAVTVRTDVFWKWGYEAVLENPLGVGPGEALSTYRVHNNFLRWTLAYGWFGMSLFLIILFLITLDFMRLKLSQRFFGYGLLASYVALGFFNEPFSGKLGILFFFIVGCILNQARAPVSERVEVIHESVDGSRPTLDVAVPSR